MPTSSQFVSLVTGLAVGNVFGVYLAQTYEALFSQLLKLPNLHSLVEDLFSRAKEYEKSTRKSDDGKEQ